MANQFVVHRTAYAPFTIAGTAATTYTSDAWIPAGSLITGIRIANNAASTMTAAAATCVPKIGTQSIADTVNISNLPGQTLGVSTAVSTNGMMITADGALNLVLGASATSTGGGVFEYYVDYLHVN